MNRQEWCKMWDVTDLTEVGKRATDLRDLIEVGKREEARRK